MRRHYEQQLHHHGQRDTRQRDRQPQFSVSPNQVQFSTTSNVTGNCPLLTDTLGARSTSDPGNTTISNQAGGAGLATCVGASTTPATISSSGTIHGKGFTTATLSCQ